MALEEYRRKRDFKRTAEPSGETSAARASAKRGQRTGLSYVIQKHAASHLHYDFRLELDGVLLSWAVPKGPSLDPATKRLAMQTEDHPVEYGDFEGTIPAGEYGGGTVMIWDYGTWEPQGDPRAAYQKGRLTFELHGRKLKGTWHLVRSHGDARSRSSKTAWLLFKGSDAAARPGNGAIVDERPESAKTGRSLDDIAAARDRVWHSNRADDGKSRSSKSKRTPSKSRAPKLDLASEANARHTPLRGDLEPCLATLVSEAPAGDGWLHEVKFDGYRLLGYVRGADVRLMTRGGKDWTSRFAELSRAVSALGLPDAVLDGEAVILREDGISDFQLLQNALGDGSGARIIYYVFDLLRYDGFDLRELPLERRKELLRAVLAGAGVNSRVRLSDHVVGSGSEFHDRACEMGLEGIISKRASSRYAAGRSRDWQKVKCAARQEFVIGGYTEPAGSRTSFGALLVGVYQGEELVYSGKVGTGFNRRSLREIFERMTPLERKSSPFSNPPRGADARGVHWLSPKLVAEVEYTCFTDEGLLRHPRFRGLRSDKSAREVVRERPRVRKATRPEPHTTRAKKAGGSQTAPQVRLTNPTRVLYPELGITKADLAEYYAAVSEWLLPHVANRPLTLVRCPEGHDKECFYQKHANDRLPAGVRPIPVPDKSGPAQYTTIDDLTGLLGLVQMGVLEIHTWGAHAGDPEHPDLLVFDLDPDSAVKWAEVVGTAKLLRERLEELELKSFVKTTGGKGLHVCVPIVPQLDWDDGKEFCRKFTESIVREAPTRFVANMSKAARKGKIFIDFFRNGRGATFIAPYSTRARPGAPVATPLAWSELSEKVRSDQFDVRTLPKRLVQLKRDPWQELTSLEQRLPAAALERFGIQ